MEKKVAISIDNLAIGYKNRKSVSVIADLLNARLFRGELTALLGPNGAGKSTLMRTLCGFLKPLEGIVRVNEVRLEKFTPQTLAKEVAVVLTDRPDLENISVRGIVALGRSPYTGFFGRLSKKDSEIIDAAIESVGICELTDRRFSSLSDGERQKTMIAKALAQQTGIIILDEPTAFLDFPSKIEIFRLLRRLSIDERKAILLSTHDMEAVLQIAQSVWLLDRNFGLTTGETDLLSENGSIAYYFHREGLHYSDSTRHFTIN